MRRILFVKTSSLGDVVHNGPAVSDVARCVPDAAIDWVVEEPFAEIAAMHRAVRRVIPVAIRRWRGALLAPRTWQEIGAFRALLRSERYDAVIDSQGLIKSALVAALAQGHRHGLDRASAREPFAVRFYQTVHGVPQDLHAVERNRRLAAAALGYRVEGACDYGLRTLAEPLVRAHSLYAVLLTMTSRDDKLWPEEHWRALGAWLERRGIQSILPWGTEEERRRCARIAAAISGATVPPRATLAALAGLAQGARCVIGVDTGLVHLAVAVNAPTLGLYAGSDPALTGLYGSGKLRNLGGPGTPPGIGEVQDALREFGIPA